MAPFGREVLMPEDLAPSGGDIAVSAFLVEAFSLGALHKLEPDPVGVGEVVVHPLRYLRLLGGERVCPVLAVAPPGLLGGDPSLQMPDLLRDRQHLVADCGSQLHERIAPGAIVTSFL